MEECCIVSFSGLAAPLEALHYNMHVFLNRELQGIYCHRVVHLVHAVDSQPGSCLCVVLDPMFTYVCMCSSLMRGVESDFQFIF